MLEGHYASRDPRVHIAEAKASVSKRRFFFLRSPLEATDALVDLSEEGLKVLSHGDPLGEGDKIEVSLTHPQLDGTLTLHAVVQWVRPEPGGEGRWGAGVHFEPKPEGEEVEQLRRLLDLELGSAVTCGVEGQVGFVAAGSESAGLTGAFFAYDLNRAQQGTIWEEPLFYRTQRFGEDGVEHRDFETFQEALRWIFRRDVKLAIEPELELRQPE